MVLRIIFASFIIALSHVLVGQHIDTAIINNTGDTLFYGKNWSFQGIRYSSTKNQHLGNGINLINRERQLLQISDDTLDTDLITKILHSLIKGKLPSLYYPFDIELNNAQFYLDSHPESKDAVFLGPASFQNVEFSHNRLPQQEILLFQGIDGNFINGLRLRKNYCKSLDVNFSKIERFYSSHNVLSRSLNLYQCKIDRLSIKETTLYTLNISYSSLKEVEIWGNAFINLDHNTKDVIYKPLQRGCHFDSDSFIGSLSISDMAEWAPGKEFIKTSSPKVCEFTDCYMNAPVSIDCDSTFSATFRKCSFDSKFCILGNVDTLVFSGVSHVSNKIDLRRLYSFRDSTKQVNLMFLDDFDVNDIRFNYTDHFQMVMDISQEQAFIKMLEKFTAEGNTQSAKRVDIELKSIRYDSQGAWGAFIHFLDKWYWGYGYNKFQPIIVILSILFILTCFNSLFWDAMNNAYKVGDDDDPKKDMTIQLEKLPSNIKNNRLYFNPLRYPVISLYNYLWSFLYTSIIFFSIRIAKDRLHFRNNGIAIAFYFFQYLLGLGLLVVTLKFVVGI